MDSGDEDMFSITDDELQLPVVQAPNPVEDHLLKQLNYLQDKIQATTSNIEEVKATTTHVLNVLERRVLYGDDVNTDSDSDLYTVDAEPVIKKMRFSRSNANKNLDIVYYWQCVLHDKWIIGIELQNKLQCTLSNLRYYPWLKDETEVHGESTFWQLRTINNRFWERIDSIDPAVRVVATMLLDLPVFDRDPTVECWGTILYEANETQFQIPVPTVQLSVADTIDNTMWTDFLNENMHNAILCLKSTSKTEKVVSVQLSRANDQNENKSEKLFHCYLRRKAFHMVASDVYMVREQGSLVYCLVEILSVSLDEARIRIVARSVSQLNIMLHILRQDFPNVVDAEKTNSYTEAARALIRELEMIRDGKNEQEMQTARLITDLLIP